MKREREREGQLSNSRLQYAEYDKAICMCRHLRRLDDDGGKDGVRRTVRERRGLGMGLGES